MEMGSTLRKNRYGKHRMELMSMTRSCENTSNLCTDALGRTNAVVAIVRGRPVLGHAGTLQTCVAVIVCAEGVAAAQHHTGHWKQAKRTVNRAPGATASHHIPSHC